MKKDGDNKLSFTKLIVVSGRLWWTTCLPFSPGSPRVVQWMMWKAQHASIRCYQHVLLWKCVTE